MQENNDPKHTNKATKTLFMVKERNVCPFGWQTGNVFAEEQAKSKKPLKQSRSEDGSSKSLGEHHWERYQVSTDVFGSYY